MTKSASAKTPHTPTRERVAKNIELLLIEKGIGDLRTWAIEHGIGHTALYEARGTDRGVSIDVLGRFAEKLDCDVALLFRP